MLTVELSVVQAVSGANRIQAQQAAGFRQCGKINKLNIQKVISQRAPGTETYSVHSMLLSQYRINKVEFPHSVCLEDEVFCGARPSSGNKFTP